MSVTATVTGKKVYVVQIFWTPNLSKALTSESDHVNNKYKHGVWTIKVFFWGRPSDTSFESLSIGLVPDFFTF